MSSTLVIGYYTPEDEAALREDFDPVVLKRADDINGLSQEVRAGITTLAFKGYLSFSTPQMDQLPNLKMISNFGVGYDAIDIKEATKRGIQVTNTPDVLNDDVADMAVLLLLMQLRQIEQAAAWAREGHWRTMGDYPVSRTSTGGKAGIVGLGRIGREIADRLAAFKMDIHYYSRREKETPGWQFHADPLALAKEVDYLIIALVGGKETDKFVTRDMIQAVGPQGVIVNISRGTTIDEAALLDALESGAIAGAGLDVFLNEPHIDPRFYALPNVVIQPHHASATKETRAAMGQLQRDNIRAFQNGVPLLTPVN